MIFSCYLKKIIVEHMNDLEFADETNWVLSPDCSVKSKFFLLRSKAKSCEGTKI